MLIEIPKDVFDVGGGVSMKRGFENGKPLGENGVRDEAGLFRGHWSTRSAPG
mgnify:CR=1 FL=1